MSQEHPEILWCVEFTLDTTMWNEGFDQAEIPWCQLYTADGSYVRAVPSAISLPNKPRWVGDFHIKMYQTVMPDRDAGAELMSDMRDDGWEEYEIDDESDRYLGFVSGTPDEINRRVIARLNKWAGV